MPEPRIRVALLYEQGGSLLLLKQEKNDRSCWLLPGGGVNYGEEIADALDRELKEELNLHLDTLGELLFVNDSVAPDKSRHIINLYFAGEVSGNPSLGGEPDIIDFAYFSARELEGLPLHPPLNSSLIDWLRGKKRVNPYLGPLWVE